MSLFAKKTRISVIMGIYNCENTLEEALDSLYNQTYKGFKIILCDDGSKDRTFEIAKKYREKYDNIILLRNKQNLKLAATLNRCIKYIDTEYVARMDADDISLPERFEKQIKFLDTYSSYAVVSTPMIYFDEEGDWGKGNLPKVPNVSAFKFGSPHTHAPSMIRTIVLKEINGYTAIKRTVRVEDYYLWYKIYKAGYKGYNLQEPLYKMRDDKNAMARRTISARYNSFLVKREVLKGLGIAHANFYALFSLFKAFVPNFIMHKVRRFKMK